MITSITKNTKTITNEIQTQLEENLEFAKTNFIKNIFLYSLNKPLEFHGNWVLRLTSLKVFSSCCLEANEKEKEFKEGNVGKADRSIKGG